MSSNSVTDTEIKKKTGMMNVHETTENVTHSAKFRHSLREIFFIF